MAKLVLKSYDEINRDRKRLRLILLLASLPFIVVIGLFAWKATTMYVNAQSTINNFEKGNYTESVENAEQQKVTNFLEQWLAYYNSGTALSAEGKYDIAISEFTQALEYAQGDIPNECYVRANLALTYEKYADQLSTNGDTLNADKNYWSASTTVEEAPLDCFPPESGGTGTDDAGTGESMEETKARSDEKNSANENSDNPDSQPDAEQPSEDEQQAQSERDQIQEQMEQSDADRKQDEASSGDGFTEPNSKPW